VDLRDAVGDRLYLSKGFHRDGVSIVTTKHTPPLTLPQDSIRCGSSDNTQVRLFPSFPTDCLLTITLDPRREHSAALSARQAIAQSRKSRGFFSIFRGSAPSYRPTYNYKRDGTACRVYGTLEVKKVTGMCISNITSVPYLLTGCGVFRSKFTCYDGRTWVCQCSACGS
jgi:hypothetical protein